MTLQSINFFKTENLTVSNEGNETALMYKKMILPRINFIKIENLTVSKEATKTALISHIKVIAEQLHSS